jgi:beta-galactosidase
MYSHDGLLWQTLNNGEALLKPTVGEAKLMRDPSIVQDSKGTFHMVWTSGWTENNIGYASSKDLIHWSEQKKLPVMGHEPDVLNTWAPELYYKKSSKTFYIIWASTITGKFPETSKADQKYNHRLYYTTTKDFEKFSETKLFYNPGFNVIDAFILKQKGLYYMFLKDETEEPAEKNIRLVSSRKLTKFPNTVSDPISGREWAEGPTAIKIGKYTYVYWDKYRNKRYGAVRCKNLRKPEWEDVTNQLRIPAGVRHGTAFKVDDTILRGLQLLEKQQ